MAWTIGDDGFEMVLTGQVPRIIGREIRGAVDAFLGDTRDGLGGASGAQHPGTVWRPGLDLAPDALATSRAVLRDYGNMSSATVMFILREMLHDDDVDPARRSPGRAGPDRRVCRDECIALHDLANRGRRAVSLAERDVVWRELTDDPDAMGSSCAPRCAASRHPLDASSRAGGGVRHSRPSV